MCSKAAALVLFCYKQLLCTLLFASSSMPLSALATRTARPPQAPDPLATLAGLQLYPAVACVCSAIAALAADCPEAGNTFAATPDLVPALVGMLLADDPGAALQAARWVWRMPLSMYMYVRISSVCVCPTAPTTRCDRRRCVDSCWISGGKRQHPKGVAAALSPSSSSSSLSSPSSTSCPFTPGVVVASSRMQLHHQLRGCSPFY
jgi:hypothetical protein